MAKIIMTAVAVAVLVSGCNSKRPASPLDSQIAGQPVTLTSAQIFAAQEGVRVGLKDPDIAKFVGPSFGSIQPNGDIDVCGTVNAKNSYGSDLGSSPYIARLCAGKAIESTSASGSEAKLLYELCHRRGVRIPS